MKKTKKICFVGGPGSGKSTLARQVVIRLGLLGYNAEHVEEYARKHIRETATSCCEFEQVFIQEKQKEKEDFVAATNCDFVVCDSASFLTYAYAIRYPGNHGKVKRNKALQEILDRAHREASSYDHIFFIPQEIPVKEDGVRFNVGDAEAISTQIEAFLKLEMIDYVTIRGTLEERTQHVLNVILNDTKSPS